MPDIDERTSQGSDQAAPGGPAPRGLAPQDLPPDLRLLKGLVTALTATMIGGLLILIALFVTRLPKTAAPAGPVLPPGLELPAGTAPRAVTFGTGWVAVVTDKDQILVFDAATGTLRQTVTLAP
jgi:hypothetical protein